MSIVRPQLLLPLFAVWLLVGLVTGFFALPSCQLGGEFGASPAGGSVGPQGGAGFPFIFLVVLAVLCVLLVLYTVINYLRGGMGPPTHERGNRTWFWALACLLGMGVLLSICTSPSLSGVGLVHGPSEVGESEDGTGVFASEVEKYRRQIEYELPMENGNSAHIIAGSLSVDVGAKATAVQFGSSRTIFTVSGAAHTLYLRHATGDIYQNGSWTQLDPVSFSTIPTVDIPGEMTAIVSEGMVYQGSEGAGRAIVLQPHRAVPELLYQSVADVASAKIDTITIASGQGMETLHAGVLPLSSSPLDIGIAGIWRPFSKTFEVEEPVESYVWRSIHVDFPEHQLAGAIPASDPQSHFRHQRWAVAWWRLLHHDQYYELPDDLPERVRSLGGVVKVRV